MQYVLILAAAITLVLGVLALSSSSNLRTTARLMLGLFFLTTTVATAALLYGSVAWGDRGAGVLGLFAVPTGLLAWFSGTLFFDGSRIEKYYTQQPDENGLEGVDGTIVRSESSVNLGSEAPRSLVQGAARHEELVGDVER